MANEFLVEGRRNYAADIRVDVRWPGVGWSRPASVSLTEHETLELIKALNAALDQAQAENAE